MDYLPSEVNPSFFFFFFYFTLSGFYYLISKRYNVSIFITFLLGFFKFFFSVFFLVFLTFFFFFDYFPSPIRFVLILVATYFSSAFKVAQFFGYFFFSPVILFCHRIFLVNIDWFFLFRIFFFLFLLSNIFSFGF